MQQARRLSAGGPLPAAAPPPSGKRCANDPTTRRTVGLRANAPQIDQSNCTAHECRFASSSRANLPCFLLWQVAWRKTLQVRKRDMAGTRSNVTRMPRPPPEKVAGVPATGCLSAERQSQAGGARCERCLELRPMRGSRASGRAACQPSTGAFRPSGNEWLAADQSPLAELFASKISLRLWTLRSS